MGRKTVLEDKLGIARRVGKQHDWNQMEILAVGNRIRHVVNGQLVADWSDPLAAECDSGPIGLQLHSNQVAQEVQWRGLLLTEDSQDKLVTAASRDLGLQFEGNPAESGLDGTRLSEIGNWARKLVDDQQASGVVTFVARRGRVVHWDAVGKADIAGGRDMTRDSVFAIASMTKPMTAAAVMILQDEGKLQLDEPGSFGHGGAFGTVSWADPRQEVLVVLLVARQNFAEERNLRAEIQELARDAIVP